MMSASPLSLLLSVFLFFFSFVGTGTTLLLSALFLTHYFLSNNKTLLGVSIYEDIWSYLHSDSLNHVF